jgi:beta-glucosidase
VRDGERVGADVAGAEDRHLAGRPPQEEKFVQLEDIAVGASQTSLGNQSHYLDAGYLPAFPFGHGLTYGSFRYGPVKLGAQSVPVGGTVEASVELQNTGKRKATELVQLYVHDRVAELTRPVRQLVDVRHVTLEPGQSERVSFAFSTDALAYHDAKLERVVEPGAFDLWIAKDAASGSPVQFSVSRAP